MPQSLFERAAAFAAEAHAGAVRIGGQPYLLHPMEVSLILSGMTNDPEVLAAGMLHDVVEDTPHTSREIAERFGPRVAALVASETEDKQREHPPEQTWWQRKSASLDGLRGAEDDGIRMLWLGDKLSNMRSFARQYRRVGDALWQQFNQKDPVAQAWYYRSIVRLLSPLAEYPAYREFTALVSEVFRDVPIKEEEEHDATDKKPH